MNQIVAPKLQSDSKYSSVLRTSVCDRAGKRHNILYCYYTHYIDLRASKQARKFVTPQKVTDGLSVTPSLWWQVTAAYITIRELQSLL